MLKLTDRNINQEFMHNHLDNNEIENPIESKEISRTKFPQIELKKGKVSINGKEIDTLEGIDGYYINPDGKSIAAYKNATTDRDKELIHAAGYRSGIFPGATLFNLGYKDGSNEIEVLSFTDNTTFIKSLSERTGHIIGQESFLDDNKEAQVIPVIAGNSYEIYRQSRIEKNDSYPSNILPLLSENGEMYLVNSNNPLQNITIKGDANQKTFEINRQPWKSLNGKNIRYSGYQVAVDYEYNKVMFFSTPGDYPSNKNYSYVINNVQWKFESEKLNNFGIQNGFAFVATKDTLVINDTKWNQSPLNADVNEQLKLVSISKEGKKIAVTNNKYVEGKWLDEVIEGDINGPTKRWKNNFVVEKIIAGENIVAVVGKDADGHSTLIINDIPMKVVDEGAEFLDLTLSEKGITVLSKTPMGEIVRTEYSLTENAEEKEKMRLKTEEEAVRMKSFANGLFQQGLTFDQLLAKLAQVDVLADQNKALTERIEQANKVVLEKQGKIDALQIQLNENKGNGQKLAEELETAKREFASMKVKALQLLETGTNVLLSKNKAFTPEVLAAIKALLQK